MICLLQGSILELKADAIVNPGNESLLGCFTPGHNCLDHQIHEKAGSQLTKDCKTIMKGKTAKEGDCIITPAYHLPCKFVIHTYGPNAHEVGIRPDLLALTYTNCLELAKKNKLKIVCFPTISTGLFGYPIEEAAEVAYSTVKKWLQKNPGSIEKVYLVTYDEKNTKAFDKFF
jgi:O-acetyl-ADP-ribose deacetylase (regulator of RNase III)